MTKRYDMDINREKLLSVYNDLLSNKDKLEDLAWNDTGIKDELEVLTWDDTENIAVDKGISAEKWRIDRVDIQMGREIMRGECANEVPDTYEEQMARIEDFIDRKLSGLLQGQSNYFAERGMLMNIIQNLRPLSEAEIFDYRLRSLVQLRKEAVRLIANLVRTQALTTIQEVCKSISADGEKESVVMDNIGALTVAGYIEIPELQKFPEVLGASSELVSQAKKENAHDLLKLISYGLLVIAAMCVLLLLLGGMSTLGAATLAGIVFDGTLAGIGATIAAEIASFTGFAVFMLKSALVSSVLSGLVSLIADLLSPNSIESHVKSENFHVNAPEPTVPV